MKLAILGAGAWGTALAIQAAARHEVRLWARDPAQAAELQRQRFNTRYLPEVALPAALQVDAGRDQALAGAELIVIASPMAGLRGLLGDCAGATPLLWLCKGFEAGSGRELGREQVGILSGPSFAQEVARGQATALVAASEWPAVAERAVQAFHGERLRVYTSADPVGVEVGGAVKNVMAIATGVADGLRERAEQAGCWAEAQGLALPEVLSRLGHVAEGVYSARTVLARGRQLGLELPISAAVVDLLEGRLSPAQALQQLMARDPRAE